MGVNQKLLDQIEEIKQLSKTIEQSAPRINVIAAYKITTICEQIEIDYKVDQRLKNDPP